MTIKVGDKLPAGTLQEFFEVEKDGCAIGPNPVKVDDMTKGRKVDLRPARRIHAHLLGEACAELYREL